MLNGKHKINSICDLENCVVLHFFNIIGKKWAYPLLYKLVPDKTYTFEEIVSFSSRRINRTMLSNLLKELTLIDIINKDDKNYKLTTKGIKLKKNLNEIKELLLNDCKNCIDNWKNDCDILKFFDD